MCLLIYGCARESSTTLVTFQHRDPALLEETIQTSLGADISFQIHQQQVIIFAPSHKIKTTLTLLAALDRPKQYISILIKPHGVKRYSTQQHDEYWQLLLGETQLGKINGEPTLLRIEPYQAQTLLLHYRNEQQNWLRAKLSTQRSTLLNINGSPYQITLLNEEF